MNIPRFTGTTTYLPEGQEHRPFLLKLKTLMGQEEYPFAHVQFKKSNQTQDAFIVSHPDERDPQFLEVGAEQSPQQIQKQYSFDTSPVRGQLADGPFKSWQVN